MTNIGYNITVVIFWLATTTWLVWTKVLPPLLLGTPPTYASMLEGATERPVVWEIYWDDEPVGSATSEVKRRDDGVIEMNNKVDFQNLSLAKLNPFRIKALNDLIERSHPRASFRADSKFEIDPLGRLLSFESSLASALMPEPIRVMGHTDGARLRLTIRSREFSYRTELYLPPDRPIGDTFSPQGRLPGLRIGQSWTEPVYSPFSPPTKPLELLHATVECEDYLLWGGGIRTTYLVLYRPEASARAGAAMNEPRGRTWVGEDGTVLQQEVRVGGSLVRFVRMPEKAHPIRVGQQERRPSD